MKTQLISTLTMWALIAISVVLLVLFFVSEEETGVEYLMYGMYAFGGIMVAGMLVNMVLSFINKDWGLIRVVIAVIATIACYYIFSLVIGGEGDEAIADGYCYTIYALTALAIVAVIGCASGIIYKLGNKH